jgi:asparagine synthase (glutamine-hydrolysing)
MCGIAGVVARSGGGLAPIRAMTEALRHRGPDDEGYLLADSRGGGLCAYAGPDTVGGLRLPPLPAHPPEAMDVALGHRRLAILDLSPAGHGPMASADGRLWITYNGEVYNYLELRRELEQLGHAFRSGTDTEVLLAAYAQWGKAALHRFNGMWSFAIYDARERVLFCARDRFGVKPFHYHWDGALFAFASEIKALLAHPGVPRRAHAGALSAFLAGGAVDEGAQTCLDGIARLQGGHHLTLDLRARRLSIERWYALPETPAHGGPEQLAAALEDAVRLRLRSDVDVGTCLSGGLDSSAIVALCARLRTGEQTSAHHSFSVLYPDRGLDESAHVAAVVAATGVRDHRATPTAAELARDLPALARAQDEPFPSAALYSQYRVMQLAHAAGLKVLLDGQGADEVLAGYHYHFGPFLADVARTHGAWRALREARAIRSVTGRPLPFLLGMLGFHALPFPDAVRDFAVSRFATHSRLPGRMLLESGLDFPSARHLPRASLAEERRADINEASLPALLRYEDRNAMAFSIEARTPFLDYRLVESALGWPAEALIRDGWTKAPLRDATRGLVPETVRLRRDKLGFATPERRFLREMAPQVRDWLGPDARIGAFLRPGRLRPFLGGSDAALAARPGLFRLLSAEMWLRHVVEREASPS